MCQHSLSYPSFTQCCSMLTPACVVQTFPLTPEHSMALRNQYRPGLKKDFSGQADD